MPRFLLFCHRFFELRFITATGVIENLSRMGEVTVMLPAPLAKSFKAYLPENVKIEIADYKSGLSRLRHRLLGYLGDILYLTFPNTHILPNATARLHRDHYTSGSRVVYHAVVGTAVLASRHETCLKLIRFLYQSLLPKTVHQDLIRRIRPDLMIGCSFGLGIEDSNFLAEAKHNGIRSAVVVQTWDRSSNKGYPTVHPDHALVWNDIMKLECVTHLGFEGGQIIVTGSPLWDQHFSKLATAPDPGWRKNLGIAENAKVIFFACGEFRSHPANMRIIPQVFEMARTQPFAGPVHVVFRLYPYYLSPSAQKGEAKKKKDELEALLDSYRGDAAISILYPDFKFDGENFMPDRGDHEYMTECLRQCDLSISMVSSQMIEACLFDKPAINLEFGKRSTEKYEIEIADYRPEHLLRIYRTGAIYRVQSAEQLHDAVAAALSNTGEKHEERLALITQEASVNQGQASLATAEALLALAVRPN